MITRIHINRHIIRANRQRVANGDPVEPPISVVIRGKTHHVFAALIDGPSQLIYCPDKPLQCGAQAWIETHAPVTLISEP